MAPRVTIRGYLWIDSAWLEITQDVQIRGGSFTIQRGAQDEQSTLSAQTLSGVLLNNGTSKYAPNTVGRYSPRNPGSELYGKIGRNTLFRLDVDTVTRFVGEIAELPPRWDTSGRDKFIPVSVAGIMRRLGQGDAPTSAAAQSWILSQAPYAYWPLTDGPTTINGVNLGSAGGQGFVVNRAAGSSVVAQFGQGDLGDFLPPGLLLYDSGLAELTAYSYPAYSVGHTDSALDVVFKTEVLGTFAFRVTDNIGLGFQVNISTTTLEAYKVTGYGAIGALTVTLLGAAPGLPVSTDGNAHHLRIRATRSGSDTNWFVYIDGGLILSGTVSSALFQGINLMTMVYQIFGDATPLAIEQMVIWQDAIPTVTTAAAAALAGFSGETAASRIARVTAAEGIPFTLVGSAADTVLMGPQPTSSALSVIQECAAADLGLLAEPRDALGLVYVTRAYSENRPTDLELDESAGHLFTPFEPTDDDQTLRNDITVTATVGSSARATLTTGPLSTADPADQTGGVGTYTDSVSVNVIGETALRDQAGWRLHLGTTDALRFPALTVHRQRAEIVADPTLDAEILAADLGQRLTVTNTGARLYSDIDQIIRGTTEEITQSEHVITFVGAPQSPYQVGTYDAADSDEGGNRYTSDGTTVQAATTSTATTLPISTLTGPVWAHNDGDYDLAVGGEVVTVTAVDATSPSFVAASTAVTGNNTSLSPTLPAGTATGDLVLILATSRNTGASVTLPSGWTIVAGTSNVIVLGRVYNGVWTMPSVAFTGGSSGDDTLAQAASFRHADIEGRAGYGASNNSSAQNINYATGNLVRDNAIIIRYLWKQDDWTSVAALAGFTAIGAASSTAGNDAAQTWFYRITGTDRSVERGGTAVVTGGGAAISLSSMITFPLLQKLTVTRSVNGVVKAQTAGTAVELAEPAYYAL